MKSELEKLRNEYLLLEEERTTLQHQLEIAYYALFKIIHNHVHTMSYEQYSNLVYDLASQALEKLQGTIKSTR